MNISKEQLKKYIEIQKNERGVQLTEKEAMEEAQSLLLFVKTVLRASYEQKKQIQLDVESKKI